MSNLNVAIKGMTWTTISTVIRSLVSLFQVAILTRFLSKADFGLVAIATVFIGFSQIFLDLGISVGILHKQNITRNQYSSLFWLNILTGIVITIILIVISPFVTRLYGEPTLTPILILLSTSVFFSSIGNQHRIVQQKNLRFKLISLVEISGSLLTMLVAVLLCIAGKGIYSLVFSTLFNAIYTNLAFLCIGIRQDNNVYYHFNIKDTFSFLKIGVFSLGTQLLDYFSREMDVIIISSTLGKEVLGIYSLCKKLILALYNAVNPILMKVMTPMLAMMQNDLKRLQRVYYDIVETIAFVNFPIYCLVAIFSFVILKVMYGVEYTEGALTLSLLALHYGYLTTGNPIGSLQTALGRTDSGFYWTICRIIFYTGATYLGALYGIEYIVLSLILTSILSLPISWKITVEPLIGGRFREFFMLSFRPYLCTIIYSAGFYYFFSKESQVYICVLIGIIYIALYIYIFLMTQKKTYLFTIINKAYVNFNSNTIF